MSNTKNAYISRSILNDPLYSQNLPLQVCFKQKTEVPIDLTVSIFTNPPLEYILYSVQFLYIGLIILILWFINSMVQVVIFYLHCQIIWKYHFELVQFWTCCFLVVLENNWNLPLLSERCNSWGFNNLVLFIFSKAW